MRLINIAVELSYTGDNFDENIYTKYYEYLVSEDITGVEIIEFIKDQSHYVGGENAEVEDIEIITIEDEVDLSLEYNIPSLTKDGWYIVESK